MGNSSAVRITSAEQSHEDDLNARTKKYLILMAIRMVCFFGAVFAHGWLRWTLVAGAVILPWIAVLIANAVARRWGTPDAPALIDSPPPPRLEHRPAPPADAAPDLGEVIDGEVMDSADDAEDARRGE